jgi:RHS repeat-associated protein
MGGWLAKVAAVSVIPKVVQALKSALAAPAPSEVSSPKPDSHVKYTSDQVGSVRELVDSTGAVRADYRYSTYGERTKVDGDLEADFGFGGLFHHGPSGLDLATYRTYDSKMGRWISRDPLGEGVDYNLYRYCGNNPIKFTDPLGLDPLFPGNNIMLGQAVEIVSAANPGWTTNVGTSASQIGLSQSPTSWSELEAKNGPMAGVTGEGYSWIHTQRLAKIEDPTYRLFKYIETVAHELYHQNHPYAWESTATTYGRDFLKQWVGKNCDNHVKTKYKIYLQIFQMIENEWGD